MRQVIALAAKDLRLLPRSRSAFFFTLVWPLVVAVLFGLAFGGSNDGPATAIKVAVVDDDASAGSRAFVTRLTDSGHFAVQAMTRPEAEIAVRQGRRAAFLTIRQGFGERSGQPFGGEPREIEVGHDPSRKAEGAMIDGLLMKVAAEDMQSRLSNRDWQPLRVTGAAVRQERVGPANSFEITFPQGVLWGLIGCMMSFGLGLVGERTRGTFVRLQMAPLTRAQILGGKALACFVSMLAVQTVLYTLGYVAFGVRPGSWPLLLLASLSITVAFCGLMMLVATLGDTEQAASGAAWAIMMPLSMVGGGMIPQFVMPAWMNAVGVISPMRWAIRAMEGALWRQFSLADMAVPCVILATVGLACFTLGSRRLATA